MNRRADRATVWVIGLEQNGDHLMKVTRELLSKARDLADQRETGVTLAVMGSDVSAAWKAEAQSVGCDRIVLLTHPRLRPDNLEYRTLAFTKAIRHYAPEIVLFPATADGRDLAPKISCNLMTGLTADCTDLRITEEGDLLQIRPTYGGSLMASIRTPNHRPQMASVRPNVISIKEFGSFDPVTIEELELTIHEEVDRIRFVSSEELESAFGNLEEAKVIIAGGYGLKSKENFSLLLRLCNKVNAVAAATRKVVDEGWAPAEIQVGQTGKTVAPDVYFAFGISGALQHTLGMNHSKKIIAVNRDPAAPIFGIADMAVLGDAALILNEMCERLNA